MSSPLTSTTHKLRIFSSGPQGGNPLTLILDAQSLSSAAMQQVATTAGHESGFILPAPSPNPENLDFEFRFWVPNHEMEMCGHATVGAVWLLERLGRLAGIGEREVRIGTRSGLVEARVTKRDGGTWVEISQGVGVVEILGEGEGEGEVLEELLSVLGITTEDLAGEFPIQNSKTSRVKTLIPVKSVEVLDGLKPDFSRVKRLCERLGSTGLYPYAVSDRKGWGFDARQFPKESGYHEDPATGIASSALAFGLLENGLVGADSGREVRIRQGRAMGLPSEIVVRFRVRDGEIFGCWIGGTAVPDMES